MCTHFHQLTTFVNAYAHKKAEYAQKAQNLTKIDQKHFDYLTLIDFISVTTRGTELSFEMQIE